MEGASVTTVTVWEPTSLREHLFRRHLEREDNRRATEEELSTLAAAKVGRVEVVEPV